MSFRIRILFFVAFELMLFRAEAQDADTTGIPDEGEWQEKMSSKITVDLSLNNSFKAFEVKTSANKTLLYPNTPNNVRLNVSYEFLSLGIQFAPDFLPGNGDEDQKGETSSFQIGSLLVLKHWFAEANYSRVKGFYLKNTLDFDPGWTDGDPYVQFPDLNYEGVSLSAGYIHNSRFSLRSLTMQTERQLKSVGSFMPVFNIDHYVVNDKSAAINTQRSRNVELNMGPGYVHTLVFQEQFYASLGVFGGIGYLNTKLTTRTASGNVVSNQDNLLWRGDCKAGIGFNGRKFYSALFTSISGTTYRQENTTVKNTGTRVFYRFVVGMRFDAPKFLVNGMNKLKKAI
ncbi:DUF4421 family protein [Robertkochia sediminum]|uniref:DUF4421 family protein n=1 Tax=Robertkochia sediminum TaxID=2785326 RepID=UPI001931831E|nr:DUF4421 family protein [Robertkochia sediminum]MBL7473133.1 DUF4421 family protein [Robertkochia sediminum]